MEIKHIIKRDYETDIFELDKIVCAIEKAMLSVNHGTREDAVAISKIVIGTLLERKLRDPKYIPNVEQVQDIVDEFNISRRCLYSKFSKISAGSVYGQIRRIRVEKISKMLTETNLSIKEIAFSFGFSDVDHISRLFRKEKGMTPTQYRAKYL